MPKVTGYHEEDAVLRRREMGRRIEFARNKMQLGKRDFAKLIGISPSSYTAWITGKSSPTVHSLAKLCEITDIPSSFFNPEKLSDVRDVDRFAHDLVAKLGVERVQEMLNASQDELDAGTSAKAVSAQIILDQLCDRFTHDQVQQILLTLLMAHETGMVDTLLESNRNVLFAIALAHEVDVERLDTETRAFVEGALKRG